MDKETIWRIKDNEDKISGLMSDRDFYKAEYARLSNELEQLKLRFKKLQQNEDKTNKILFEHQHTFDAHKEPITVVK